MAVLVSDKVQKTDCIRCRVSQASYGRFCASCFFVLQSQEKLELVLEAERAELRRSRLIGHLLITALAIGLLGLAVYVRSWFE